MRGLLSTNRVEAYKPDTIEVPEGSFEGYKVQDMLTMSQQTDELFLSKKEGPNRAFVQFFPAKFLRPDN